jgi:ATP-dependent DNA ligase
VPRIVKRSASQAVNAGPSRRGTPLPQFVPPQLSQPVEKPPSGTQWLHEIKLDGYRMAARIDNDHAQLLTRTGLDWTDKYPSAVAALANLDVKTAYLDSELCGVDDAGIAELRPHPGGDRWRARGAARLLRFRSPPSRGSRCLSAAAHRAQSASRAVSRRQTRPSVQCHDRGDGELILRHAGKLGFEGVVSKTIDAPYAPGNRGLWRKAKWLNRQEFVVVGWSDPEGSRPHLGALLLGCTRKTASPSTPAEWAQGCSSGFLPISGGAWTCWPGRHRP